MVTDKERHGELEQLIGGRVLAWVGAAAVVAGLALLLALGISQGWIGEGMRTLTAAVVSLGLLGAGAWLHERRGQVQAARAAAATGICGLFMTATVATALYDLLPAVPGLAPRLRGGLACDGARAALALTADGRAGDRRRGPRPRPGRRARYDHDYRVRGARGGQRRRRPRFGRAGTGCCSR